MLNSNQVATLLSFTIKIISEEYIYIYIEDYVE
jgi:hypothetical protein